MGLFSNGGVIDRGSRGVIVKPLPKRIKNDLIYLLALFFVKVLRLMPRSAALSVMRRLGVWVFYLARKEREKTVRHLTWAFGNEKRLEEITALARSVFRHFGAALADAIRVPLLSPDQLAQLVRVQGEEHLSAALAAGRGAIILTAHFGNWELLASWISRRGYPLKVVGRSAYDPRLDRMIVAGREQAGYTNIARGKATREIVRALHQNQCLGLLIDQDTQVEGVFVDFFHRPAHTAIGPAVLSKKFGAAVIPSFIHLLPDDTYQIDFFPAIKWADGDGVSADWTAPVQQCSDVIEGMIRRPPEQWVWMHDRGKKKPRAANEL